MKNQMSFSLDIKKTTVFAAAELLEHLGSDQDPIYYQGEETTAADLAATLPETKIDKIRIGYFGLHKGHLCRIRHGTFAAMIRDRGGAQKAHENAEGYLRHAHLAGDSPDY